MSTLFCTTAPRRNVWTASAIAHTIIRDSTVWCIIAKRRARRLANCSNDCEGGGEVELVFRLRTLALSLAGSYSWLGVQVIC